MTITDVLRPQDPLAFIASFLLKNKGTMKKIEDMLEIHPNEIHEEVTGDGMEEEGDEMEKLEEKK